MEVVANALARRVFFGVYKTQKPLMSHAPISHEDKSGHNIHNEQVGGGQRKRLQMLSGVGLRTEGGGGAESLGVSGDPLLPA